MVPLTEFAFAVLDDDRRARLFLSDELAILWANGAAHLVFERSLIIQRRDNALFTSTPTMQPALDAFIRGSTSQGTSWCFPDPGGDGYLILRCRRLQSESQVVYALTLICSGSQFEASYTGVQQAYDLTRSEYKVLSALLSGLDAEAIARSHGVAMGTIRSHVKALYTKMRVNSREALFRLTLPFSE